MSQQSIHDLDLAPNKPSKQYWVNGGRECMKKLYPSHGRSVSRQPYTIASANQRKDDQPRHAAAITKIMRWHV